MDNNNILLVLHSRETSRRTQDCPAETLRRDQKGELNWAVCRVQLEPRHNREDAIVNVLHSRLIEVQAQVCRIENLRQRTEMVVNSVRSLETMTIEDFTVSLSGTTDREASNLAEDLLETTLIAVKAGKSGLVLMLDEAQVLVDEKDREGQHPLSLLVEAVNSLQEQHVPLALVLCGLPTLISNLLKREPTASGCSAGKKLVV
ncbi:hypothetical protein [Arthrobacter sp. A5]|uniref:hypothetical protein n=1 Tax=Arthrobacter sp. A5 TaxID=576926 RepID=UPI003DA897FB